MQDQHTLMDSRTFKRPPIAILSPEMPMPSATLFIAFTMDMAVLKAEDSLSLWEGTVLWDRNGPSLWEGAALWELAGSPLWEGEVLWEPVGLWFLRLVNIEKNFLTFKKNFLNTFMVVSVRDMRVYWPDSVLIYTTEHEADTLILILLTRGRAASNMRVYSRRLRRLRHLPLV